MQLKEIRKRTAGGEMQLTEKKEKLNIAMLGVREIIGSPPKKPVIMRTG